MGYEATRLGEVGYPELASHVTWVSEDLGDRAIGVLPQPVAAGLTLENSGADLWNALVRAHAEAQLAGAPEIQMDYFTRAVESSMIVMRHRRVCGTESSY